MTFDGWVNPKNTASPIYTALGLMLHFSILRRKTNFMHSWRTLLINISTVTILMAGIATLPCNANPRGWGGGGWNEGCAGGYYRGGCNPGGWYGTGIPNGLGWTLFGLAAAGVLAAGAACAPAYGTYVAPAPVYAPAPVFVQQPVVVQPTATVVQAPLVNYNGVLCYYINGNYYPANPVR